MVRKTMARRHRQSDRARVRIRSRLKELDDDNNLPNPAATLDRIN